QSVAVSAGRHRPDEKILVKLARFRWARRMHEIMFSLPADPFFIVNLPLQELEPLVSPILKSVCDIAEFTRTELHAKFVLLVFPRSFQYSAAESPNSWERDAYQALSPYSHSWCSTGCEPASTFPSTACYTTFKRQPSFRQRC